MNLIMMLAASQGITPAASPTLTGITITTASSGVCSGAVLASSAAVQVAWTAARFDSALHTYKVYENDILKATQLVSPWIKKVNGYVEAGPSAPWTSAWTFRVDIVNAAGDVLSSITSSQWVVDYGRCGLLV